MECIAPGIHRMRFGEPEALTPVSLRRSEIDMEGLSRLPNDRCIFSDGDMSFTVTARGCTLTLPLTPDEGIYGLGLQLKSFNQRGLKKTLRTNSDPVADTGDSHAPVPFYCSTAGYGILVDTARYVTFYCGTHDRQKNVVSAECNEEVQSSANEQQNSVNGSGSIIGKDKPNVTGANPTELYSLKNQRNSRSMIVDIPSAEGVDVYLFEGPQMIHAVRRYNLFSGGGCLPPMWGLGVWYRIWGKADAGHATKLAEYLREAEMPCDVFGFEPGWHSHAYSCSYQWNPESFPQPEALIAHLNDSHFKVNLWEHAFVHPSAPFHDDIASSSGDTLVWGGLVPDFTLNKARKQFGNYHRDQFLKNGISGFKLDECDSSDYCPSPWSFPDCAAFPSGLDGEQMHSLLGMMYQSTLHDVFTGENRRTYGQCRSSHALAAPFPFVIYSDLYDHADFVRGVANMGFSGLLWSPEVRQCGSVEELIRRIQSVILSPQALVNAWMIPNPPWLQVDLEKNLKGEFLENATQVETMCRTLFRLRMSLIPYLYTAFAAYRHDGVPPFRALVLDYPDDVNVYGLDDAFMMGEALLVAPVLAGHEGRKVYLPHGMWYCFWTNAVYEGGRWHELRVPLEQIPMFVKENVLLPLAEPVDYVMETTCFRMHVRSYGNASCSFELIEDDAFSLDHERGISNRVMLERDGYGEFHVTRSGAYPGKRYDILSFEGMD